MTASARIVEGVILDILGGIALAFQSGINATLGTYGGKGFAGVISFGMGLVAFAVYFLISVYAANGHKPHASELRQAPWWSWIGGLLGAYYVLVGIIFAQDLGAATLLGIFVCAQLITSIFLDGFGLVGFPKRKVRWERIVGAVLMIAGIVLVTVFKGDVVSSGAPGPTAASAAAAPTGTVTGVVRQSSNAATCIPIDPEAQAPLPGSKPC